MARTQRTIGNVGEAAEPFPLIGDFTAVETSAGAGEPAREDVYFDTPDLRLAAAGIVVRHQLAGDGGRGWWLTLGSDEIRVTETGTQRHRRRPPPDVVALTRAFTRDAVLTQVASVITTRRRLELRDRSGATVAEVLDDTVHGYRTGADTGAVAWREIELVPAGATVDQRLLREVERRFRRAGLRRGGAVSSLARVLGDRWPKPQAPATLAQDATLAAVVLAYLREHAGALRQADPQLRRQVPDAVHRMRVASRRLRSTLQAYGRVIDRDSTRDLADELRWLAGELGAARDLEVQHERFRDALAALPEELVLGPVDAGLTRVFAPQEAQAQARAVAALDGDRYLALLDRIDRLLADPPLTELASRPARAELAALVARSQRRLDRALAHAEQPPPGHERDLALHEARKAAKRLRYALEAARPVLGKPARRLTTRLKGLQQVLGDHHDSVVARPVLRELAVQAHHGDGNGFTFGLLHAQEAALARDCESAVPGKGRQVRAAALS